MSPDPDRSTPNPEMPAALSVALEKSHDVLERVEACADDLSTANQSVKQGIDQGATTLSAHDTLQKGEIIEATVQECADDLNEVNDHLAQGIADLAQVDIALTRSRAALAETQAALAAAQQDSALATQRAMHDGATGLANRGLFDDRLAHAIQVAERNQWTLAVLFIDLDRFKRINDEHGHAIGDRVLKEVAGRLLQSARVDDTVCRNGGDEFLVLLLNQKGRDNAWRVATELQAAIARPMFIDGREHAVGASIGIALYPSDGTAGAQLIERADSAMYCAKRASAGCALYRAAPPVHGTEAG